MRKPKLIAEPDKGGRPTKFKPEYTRQAALLAARGLTDKEAADFFGVSLSTFNLWKVKQSGFSDALIPAKDIADARMERSLYNRGIEGSDTAAIFWLKNRKPDTWRDVKAQEISAPGGDKLTIQIVKFGEDPE